MAEGVTVRAVVIALLLVAMPVLDVARADAEDHAPTPARHDGKTAAEWEALLSSDDLMTRKRAAYGLWSLGPAANDAAGSLVEALCDADPYVRGTAAKAVERLDPQAVVPVLPALADELLDERQDVRREAATLFWRLGPLSAEVVPQLAKALGSEDSSVRANVAASLGNAGVAARPALAALVERLDDPNFEVRKWAAKAVALVDPATAFASDDPVVRLEALKTYAAPERRGWTNIDVVAGVLKTVDDPDVEIRGLAIHALDTFAAFAGDAAPVEWIPVFQRVLEEELAPAVAARGATGLGRYRGHGKETVPVLAEAAGSPEPEVRRAAVLALGWLDAEARPAVDAILQAMETGDAATRGAAAVSLGRIGVRSRAVLDALIDVTGDRDRMAARNAIQSLSRVGQGDERASNALLGVFQDPERSHFVRGDAAKALGSVGGGPKVVAVLTKSLDEDSDCPDGVAFALVALGAPATPRALGRLTSKATEEGNNHALLALGYLRELGPKAALAVPDIASLLSREEKGLRLSAAGVLQAIGPAAKEALPALQQAAEDPDSDVAAAAQAAICTVRAEVE